MSGSTTSIEGRAEGRRRPTRGTCLATILAVAVMSANVGVSSAMAFPDSSANVIRTWNGLALQTVRAANASDAQAARLFAMVNVAMYDAVNGLPGLGAHQLRAEAMVSSRPGTYGDQVSAAAGAAHDVLAALYPDQAPLYDAQLAADLGSNGVLRAAGRAWGGEVAARVLAARADDGSSPNETQPAGAGAGVFRPAGWACSSAAWLRSPSATPVST